MRPWVGLLLLAALAFAAQGVLGLPPIIITVKNLKAKSGPTYKWTVNSHVRNPFTGPVYPGKTSTARVTVDVQRTSITKNYVVTGKLIVTNPLQNSQPVTVMGLKASFGQLLPLVTGQPPLPLDCPQQTLESGQSLSCSFRLELSSAGGVATTLTPLVFIQGMPQLQGEPLALAWPEDEDHQLPNGQVVDQESSCALIQLQVVAGELQPVVRVSTSKEYEDMLQAGLEVCDERVALEYDVSVGPFDDSSGLCGAYTIRDVPIVRLAAGSIGSSSISSTSMPVILGGCRQKDILGGHKPSIDITKLTLAKFITHEWAARPISSTNTSSPATVNYDMEHTVDVAVHMQRTVVKEELMVMGQVTITNTEMLPYLLPAGGVRLALSKDESSQDKRYITVTCPMVGNNIVIRPMLDGTPGTLVCEFKEGIQPAMKKGYIQAQLQTLLSAKHEVDSGAPRSYDFDDKASAQIMQEGECVSMSVMRVTNPVDIMSANQNPAVASLAQDMGGDKFKLVPLGFVTAGTIPPAANSQAEPMVLCGNSTVSWQESYGPFTEYDCGPNMALMGLTAKPTSGPADAVTATLAFPMAVKHCMLKPDIKPSHMRAYNQETFTWNVRQSREPAGDISVNKSKKLHVKYKVDYDRSSLLAGFKVTGLFKVMNPHSATLNLDDISYLIERPTGEPIKGEASCSGTYEDATGMAAAAAVAAAAQKKAAGSIDSTAGGSLQPQTSLPSSTDALMLSGRKPALKKAAKYKMAAVKYVKVKRQAKGLAVASAVAYEDEEEAEYEEGGNGPLFCSFEAYLPDDYPAKVTLIAETDEGAKVTESLGVIDWDNAETAEGNKCAMASFAFSSESNSLIKPSHIEGEAPPALAVKICEPKCYNFEAIFGPWSGPSCCGPKQAISTAVVSLPNTATVIDSEDKVHIDVTGCQLPLPTVTVEASQHPIKDTWVWSIVRRMTPIGPDKKHPDPAVTVAGPGNPTCEPAVLMLSAKHNANAKGAFTKFNQTITLKRTKPSYDGKEHKYEVKGEVKIVNHADQPLHLQEVQVKIVCDGEGDGNHKPIIVTATCPQHCYDSYGSATGKESKHLTIPATASNDDAIKCKFGAVVPGPAAVAVHAVAILDDSRKAKAKHSVHLKLQSDFFKPATLGSCIRVLETQHVRDLLTGADVDALTTQGAGVPADWKEVCKTTTWSTVNRVGPLESYDEGCQAVTYESAVEAVPSSGYQGPMHSNGVVEVHTRSCKNEDEGSGSAEEYKKTPKGGDAGKDKGGKYEGSDKNDKGDGKYKEKKGDGKQNKKDGYPSKGSSKYKDKQGKDKDQGKDKQEGKKPKDSYKEADGSKHAGGSKDSYSSKGKQPEQKGYSHKPGKKDHKDSSSGGEGQGGEGYTGPDNYGKPTLPPLPGYSGGSSGGGGLPPIPGYSGGDDSGSGLPSMPGYGGGTGLPPLPGYKGGGGDKGLPPPPGYGGGDGGSGLPPLPGYNGGSSGSGLPPLPGYSGGGGGSDYVDNYPSVPSPTGSDYGSSKPSLPSPPGNSYPDTSYPGSNNDDSQYSDSMPGSNVPQPGTWLPAPKDSGAGDKAPNGAQLPGTDGSSGSSDVDAGNSAPAGVWLPGLDATAKDESDEEGGEGFDDNTSVDFWKGSSRSKLLMPGQGNTKLVTSSEPSKATTSNAKPAKTGDLLSADFWAKMSGNAKPQVAGQGEAQSAKPAVSIAAKPAAAAAAAVKPAAQPKAAIKPADKPAPSAAGKPAAATKPADKHGASAAGLSIATASKPVDTSSAAEAAGAGIAATNKPADKPAAPTAAVGIAATSKPTADAAASKPAAGAPAKPAAKASVGIAAVPAAAPAAQSAGAAAAGASSKPASQAAVASAAATPAAAKPAAAASPAAPVVAPAAAESAAVVSAAAAPVATAATPAAAPRSKAPAAVANSTAAQGAAKAL